MQDFFLKYLASTWAVVLIIGPFFGGHLRPEDSVRGRAAMLSDMRYHTSVIISLFRCSTPARRLHGRCAEDHPLYFCVSRAKAASNLQTWHRMRRCCRAARWACWRRPARSLGGCRDTRTASWRRSRPPSRSRWTPHVSAGAFRASRIQMACRSDIRAALSGMNHVGYD